MKVDKSIIARAERNIREAREEPKVRGDQQAANLINQLFEQLLTIKPAWKNAFPNAKDQQELERSLNTLKKNWIKAFAENGINSTQQLSIGMRKARQDPNDFLPSVGKFMEWCKPDPQDFGLPTAEQAYTEACRNAHQIYKHQWSHPAVYHAGKETGWHEIKSTSSIAGIKNLHDSFVKAYKSLCERVLNGERLDIPEMVSNALEHQSGGHKTPTTKNKTIAQATLDELRSKL